MGSAAGRRDGVGDVGHGGPKRGGALGRRLSDQERHRGHRHHHKCRSHLGVGERSVWGRPNTSEEIAESLRFLEASGFLQGFRRFVLAKKKKKKKKKNGEKNFLVFLPQTKPNHITGLLDVSCAQAEQNDV